MQEKLLSIGDDSVASLPMSGIRIRSAATGGQPPGDRPGQVRHLAQLEFTREHECHGRQEGPRPWPAAEQGSWWCSTAMAAAWKSCLKSKAPSTPGIPTSSTMLPPGATPAAFWLGPAIAGQQVTLRLDTTTLHVSTKAH